MTPRQEFEHDIKLDEEARVRQGVKAVLEEVLEEEMSEHIGAGLKLGSLNLSGASRVELTLSPFSNIVRRATSVWKGGGGRGNDTGI